MKRMARIILWLSLVLLLSACGKSKDVVVNDLNLGKLEYEGIKIMGVTYDFYDNGYAAITAILHENARLSETVTFEKKKYTVTVLGDIKVEASDVGHRDGVFGNQYSGIKSPVILELPDTIVCVGSSALEYSTAEVIKLPSKALRFSDRLFRGCKNIETIEWPAGTEFIGGYEMFEGCSSLKTITFPENCEISTLDGCFLNCTSLESVIIPGTVYKICNMAFSNCPELTSVTLGEGIEKVGSWAFMSCPKLTHIVIPESVTELTDEVFHDCAGLKDVTLPDNLNDVPAKLFVDLYSRPTDAAGITIRVKADMVSYVQSIYPAANVVAK